jgi:superfamily II DNA or RNA helicase
MENRKGYIYVRENETTKLHNVLKIGKTGNIVNRGSAYHTYEICPGNFIKVIEIPLVKMDTIEKMILKYFKHFNVMKGAGKEYFKKEVLDQIIPYLKTMSIVYRELTCEEVKKLERKIYIKKLVLENVFQQPQKIKDIKMPRKDQFEIIEKVISHFSRERKGFLILPCGVGKTLISLWIMQRMKWSKILVGVPSCNLLVQWKNTFEELNYFKDGFKIVLIQQGVSETDIANISTHKRVIVITTYQSCNKLLAQKFDVKICDEMHHLTSKDSTFSLQEERKTNLKFLVIETTFQLGLTATPRIVKEDLQQQQQQHHAIANDTIESFGEAIVERGLRSAIDLKTICDYRINIYSTNSTHLKIFEDFNVYDEKDQRLFLTAYGMLHLILIGKCPNWLVCANTIEACRNLKTYVYQLLLEKTFACLKDEIYVNVFTSDLRADIQKTILQKFENSEKGILINVQCLAEGYSFTGLHGVAIAEPIHSKIRATQFLTRNLRLLPSEPDKIGTMFIPHIEPDEDEDYETKKKAAFETIRDVLDSLGEEEKAIYGRLVVSSFKTIIEDIDQNQDKTIEKVKKIKEVFPSSTLELTEELTEAYIENIKKFRLKEYTSRGLITYSKMKFKLKEKKITSVPEYLKLCETDSQFPENPREVFQETFKSWMDYLSIEEISFYTLEECRKKITDLMRWNTELKKLKLKNKLAEILSSVSKTDDKIPSTIELIVDLYRVSTLNDFFIA